MIVCVGWRGSGPEGAGVSGNQGEASGRVSLSEMCSADAQLVSPRSPTTINLGEEED